ncbi:MAG: hypothetical protein PQJ59_11305 [Spirochaetales bacterium]|nr:hypothetical protein [Spirochaetales bacterium]
MCAAASRRGPEEGARTATTGGGSPHLHVEGRENSEMPQHPKADKPAEQGEKPQPVTTDAKRKENRTMKKQILIITLTLLFIGCFLKPKREPWISDQYSFIEVVDEESNTHLVEVISGFHEKVTFYSLYQNVPEGNSDYPSLEPLFSVPAEHIYDINEETGEFSVMDDVALVHVDWDNKTMKIVYNEGYTEIIDIPVEIPNS